MQAGEREQMQGGTKLHASGLARVGTALTLLRSSGPRERRTDAIVHAIIVDSYTVESIMDMVRMVYYISTKWSSSTATPLVTSFHSSRFFNRTSQFSLKSASASLPSTSQSGQSLPLAGPSPRTTSMMAVMAFTGSLGCLPSCALYRLMAPCRMSS